MCLKYNEGWGEGDVCPTRDSLPPWSAPARQLSLCSGSFADPSLATLLLQCFTVIDISEHEADDELEAVAIPREKPRPKPRVPQPPGVQHHFIGFTRRV